MTLRVMFLVLTLPAIALGQGAPSWWGFSQELAAGGAEASVPYPQSNFWVGAWHMEIGNSGSWIDSSTYTQTVILVGTVRTNISITGGKTNFVYQFDNFDDYGNAGDRPQYTFETNPFSLLAWVNLDATGTNNYVISKHDTAGTPLKQEWRFVFSGADLYGVLVNKGQTSLGQIGRRITGGFSTGVWTHVAMTWDGGTNYESVHLFRNGVEVDDADFGNGIFSGMSNSTAPVHIGFVNGGATNEYFDGFMDDVQIYGNKALTTTQLTNMVAQTHPLTNYWAE